MKENLDRVIDLLYDLSESDMWERESGQEDTIIEYKNGRTNFLPEQIITAKKYPKYRKSQIDIPDFDYRDVNHEVASAFSFVFKDEIDIECFKEICSKRGFYTTQISQIEKVHLDKEWNLNWQRKYQHECLGVLRISHQDMELIMWVTKDANHKLLLEEEEVKGVWNEIGFLEHTRNVALVLIDYYLSSKEVKK